VVDMHVTPLAANAGRVRMVRPNGPAPSERTYRFDVNGKFLELPESRNGAPRQVVLLSGA
jgi:hypothetical protein